MDAEQVLVGVWVDDACVPHAAGLLQQLHMCRRAAKGSSAAARHAAHHRRQPLLPEAVVWQLAARQEQKSNLGRS